MYLGDVFLFCTRCVPAFFVLLLSTRHHGAAKVPRPITLTIPSDPIPSHPIMRNNHHSIPSPSRQIPYYPIPSCETNQLPPNSISTHFPLNLSHLIATCPPPPSHPTTIPSTVHANTIPSKVIVGPKILPPAAIVGLRWRWDGTWRLQVWKTDGHVHL